MLSYREHLRRIVTPNVRWRLLALFTPNSREGFPKIGVNALGITKGVIEDRFHLCLGRGGNANALRKMHSRLRQVTKVQRVGQQLSFLRCAIVRSLDIRTQVLPLHLVMHTPEKYSRSITPRPIFLLAIEHQRLLITMRLSSKSSRLSLPFHVTQSARHYGWR